MNARALHAALVAALDAEEEVATAAGAEKDWWLQTEDVWVYDGLGVAECAHIAAQSPQATLCRVAADRRVLERHVPFGCPPDAHLCRHDEHAWPCPDTLDLAARHPTREVLQAMLALGQHEWVRYLAARYDVEVPS